MRVNNVRMYMVWVGAEECMEGEGKGDTVSPIGKCQSQSLTRID